MCTCVEGEAKHPMEIGSAREGTSPFLNTVSGIASLGYRAFGNGAASTAKVQIGITAFVISDVRNLETERLSLSPLGRYLEIRTLSNLNNPVR